MKRADYLEKRRSILSDCEEKLAALDKVFAMFGGTPVSAKNNHDANKATKEWTHAVSKRDAVRHCMKTLTGNFSLKDVKAVVNREYGEGAISDNQLSAILSKLAERKELEVIKEKAGTSPALYANKQAE